MLQECPEVRSRIENKRAGRDAQGNGGCGGRPCTNNSIGRRFQYKGIARAGCFVGGAFTPKRRAGASYKVIHRTIGYRSASEQWLGTIFYCCASGGSWSAHAGARSPLSLARFFHRSKNADRTSEGRTIM